MDAREILKGANVADMPVKVWRMNDCDWMAARTKTEAIDQYVRDTGCTRSQVLEDNPTALTKRELAKLTFVTDEEDAAGSYKRHSFALELKRRIEAGVTFPQFFASTEI